MESNAVSDAWTSAGSFLAHPATQMLLGSLLSAFVSVLLEWKKRPKVSVSIDQNVPERVTQWDADRNPVVRYEAVRLIVANLKRWPKFWPRQSLIRVSAKITFHDAHTGADLFGRPMKARWASLPQPEIVLFINNRKTTVSDLSLISNAPELDIPWGEREELDVAARFENEAAVYGWSNENYYDPDGMYRAEKWRITEERCLVKVLLQGSGERSVHVYRMTNVQGNRLRLDPTTHAERDLLL